LVRDEVLEDVVVVVGELVALTVMLELRLSPRAGAGHSTTLRRRRLKIKRAGRRIQAHNQSTELVDLTAEFAAALLGSAAKIAAWRIGIRRLHGIGARSPGRGVIAQGAAFRRSLVKGRDKRNREYGLGHPQPQPLPHQD
jgi:hypothetical protein